MAKTKQVPVLVVSSSNFCGPKFTAWVPRRLVGTRILHRSVFNATSTCSMFDCPECLGKCITAKSHTAGLPFLPDTSAIWGRHGADFVCACQDTHTTWKSEWKIQSSCPVKPWKCGRTTQPPYKQHLEAVMIQIRHKRSASKLSELTFTVILNCSTCSSRASAK